MTSTRTFTVTADGAALQLAGELDAAGAHDLHSALSERVGRGEGDVVVDLSELGFVDSIGLGALVKAAGQLERQERRLQLVGVHGAVRRAIEMMGLAERLGVDEQPGDA